MNYNQGKNHPKFVDLEGKVFGELTVLEYVQVPEKYQKVWKWKCRCSCGNYTLTRTKEFLKENPVQSCASCGRKRMGKTNILPDHASIKNRVFRRYKKGASKRGYTFELAFEDVMRLIQGNCHYCDNPPEEMTSDQECNFTNVPFKRNGIDRKYNSIGYEITNVVSCCAECNKAKLDMDYDQFIALINRCYKHLNK